MEFEFELESIALTIHLGTIICLLAVIFYTDHLGLSWVRGKKEQLPHKKLALLHRLVWAGLGVMILSGFTMFLEYQDYLLYTPAFYIKMGFVLTLIINAFFIGKLMHITTEKPFAALSHKEKLPLLISGAVSTTAWAGTIVSAFMLGL